MRQRSDEGKYRSRFLLFLVQCRLFYPWDEKGLAPQVLRFAVNCLVVGVAALAAAHWLSARYGLPSWIPLTATILPGLLSITAASHSYYPGIISLLYSFATALVVWLNAWSGISYWLLLGVVGLPAFLWLDVELLLFLRAYGFPFEWRIPWWLLVAAGFFIAVGLTVWAGRQFQLPYWACPAILISIPVMAYIVDELRNAPLRPVTSEEAFLPALVVITPQVALATALYVVLHYSLWFVPLIGFLIVFISLAMV